MRCIGRNKDFSRCRNYPKFLVCKKHRIQLIILLFITVPTIILTYDNLFHWTKDIFIKKPSLVLRETSVLLIQYPGTLFYLYNSGLGEKIASIGYAAVIEIINNGHQIDRLTAYQLELKINGEWILIPNLPILDPLSLFWANNSDLRKCIRMDFRKNGFDFISKDKEIKPGESVKG
jgi:hypothetical protein